MSTEPAADEGETSPCKICSSTAHFIGTKTGKFKQESFRFFSCDNCGFIFVANPWLDYKEIYSEDYYKGLGADPSADYLFELTNPGEALRQYEWDGIMRVVRSCINVTAETRWLDFGSGNGGLVRYCKQHARCCAWGYDQGWITEKAVKMGIPILSAADLHTLKGSFDVITAIEVLEHLPDPLVELHQIRSLLRPGGLFFFTTGNPAPHRRKLFEWAYVVPEVHISYYEPRTLAKAFAIVGLRPEFRGFLPGYEKIIRFKVLKALRFRRPSALEKWLPWKLMTRIVDARYHVTAHPIGWAA
jgi:2-polyprenyl-3-methyl-5-hydroxy-6-metoxy-1,4-benzoquinol methylase